MLHLINVILIKFEFDLIECMQIRNVAVSPHLHQNTAHSIFFSLVTKVLRSLKLLTKKQQQHVFKKCFNMIFLK